MGLGVMEFVMEVEEAFAIRIPDRVLEQIRTPRMLIDYVYRRTDDPRKPRCMSQRAFYVVRRELCARLEIPRESLQPDTDLLAILPTNASHVWGEVGAAIGCGSWPSIRGDGWFARHFRKDRPRTLGEAAKYVATFTPSVLIRPGEEGAWEDVRRVVGELI